MHRRGTGAKDRSEQQARKTIEAACSCARYQRRRKGSSTKHTTIRPCPCPRQVASRAFPRLAVGKTVSRRSPRKLPVSVCVCYVPRIVPAPRVLPVPAFPSPQSSPPFSGMPSPHTDANAGIKEVTRTMGDMLPLSVCTARLAFGGGRLFLSYHHHQATILPFPAARIEPRHRAGRRSAD